MGPGAGQSVGGRGDAPPSVSVGIVSAKDRIWGRAIQTDAKTSPVNYGGPLVDLRGRIMGILVPLSPQSSMRRPAWSGTTAASVLRFRSKT